MISQGSDCEHRPVLLPLVDCFLLNLLLSGAQWLVRLFSR